MMSAINAIFSNLETYALVYAIVAACYGFMCEFLANSEKFKANSVMQAVKNALGWIKDFMIGKKPPAPPAA